MDTLLFKNRRGALVDNALETFIPFWETLLSDTRPRRVNCFTDDGKSYSLELEMAGYGKKDVELEISEGKYLVIKGSAKKAGKDREITERFQRPSGVDATKVEAELKDGLLSIKIDKADESKPVNVKIN